MMELALVLLMGAVTALVLYRLISRPILRQNPPERANEKPGTTAENGTRHRARAARLLAKAVASEAAAQLATDRAIKQAYLDIAKQWRELADQAEGLDNSAPDRHRS